MQIRIKQIQFTDPEFESCFQIRRTVFVEEQNVPLEEERDSYDESARHFLAIADGVAAGTARVISKDDGAKAKISRVAVLRPARGLGIGAALMRQIENEVSARKFILDAQIQALPFYQLLGYAAYGDEFIEAGIPHRHMQKLVRG
jgi:predicted GNAT family N-acyltransferase